MDNLRRHEVKVHLVGKPLSVMEGGDQDGNGGDHLELGTDYNLTPDIIEVLGVMGYNEEEINHLGGRVITSAPKVSSLNSPSSLIHPIM